MKTKIYVLNITNRINSKLEFPIIDFNDVAPALEDMYKKGQAFAIYLNEVPLLIEYRYDACDMVEDFASLSQFIRKSKSGERTSLTFYSGTVIFTIHVTVNNHSFNIDFEWVKTRVFQQELAKFAKKIVIDKPELLLVLKKISNIFLKDLEKIGYSKRYILKIYSNYIKDCQRISKCY